MLLSTRDLKRISWLNTYRKNPGGSEQSCKGLFTAPLPQMKSPMFPDTYCHTYLSGGSQRWSPKDTPATPWGGPLERNYLASTNVLAKWVSSLSQAFQHLQPSRHVSSIHNTEVGVCVCMYVTSVLI